LKKREAIKLLQRLPFTFFDVFWLKSNGKKLKIHNRGSYLTSREIEKILKNPEAFEMSWEIDIDWVSEGLLFFERLHELETKKPIDLIEVDNWRIEFINWSAPSLWHGDEAQRSFLDFTALMLLGCDIQKSDFYENYENLPIEIQARNILLSSVIGYFSTLMGYASLSVMRDLFKVFLYADPLYQTKDWSNSEMKILDQISEKGWSSLNAQERNILEKNYIEKLKSSIERLEQQLINREYARLLEFSIEDYFGNGLLRNVKMNECNDLELLVILISNNINKESFALSELIERKFNDLFISEKNKSDRIRRVISSTVHSASVKNNNFLKISGL
tara:strand:+ start:1213 stop:2208 length:996 start_codon:yes stop_codon:yes gene_type:complete